MKKIILLYTFVLCLFAENVQAKSATAIYLDYMYRGEIVQQLKNYTLEDVDWLAKNIYFEARNQSLHGRMVIAFVTLNRTLNRRWPDDIKGVVRQKWQFSWYNARQVPPIKDMPEWEDAKELAVFCIDLYNSMAESEGFDFDGITHGADHYFADYIKVPSWASKMTYKGKVGVHLLYKS